MHAVYARDLTYRSNKKLKGIKMIDAEIEKTAKSGVFSITIQIHYDWGSTYDLKNHYSQLGYKVRESSQQTGPNDSDEYLSVDWSE